MRKALIVTAMVLLAACSAFAVPNLQLYIPGGTYSHATDTWITSSHDFEIWVIASNMERTGSIYDITLTAALAPQTAPVDNGFSITPFGGSAHSFMASDYHYGTPPSTGNSIGDMPGHGIFPTNYVEYLVTGQTSDTYVDTWDVTDPSSHATGNIFKFFVSSTYDYLHFDAYGFLKESDGKFIKAPFSHDAEMSTVPEPGTMLLFGLGLLGAGIARKAKK